MTEWWGRAMGPPNRRGSGAQRIRSLSAPRGPPIAGRPFAPRRRASNSSACGTERTPAPRTVARLHRADSDPPFSDAPHRRRRPQVGGRRGRPAFARLWRRPVHVRLFPARGRARDALLRGAHGGQADGAGDAAGRRPGVGMARGGRAQSVRPRGARTVPPSSPSPLLLRPSKTRTTSATPTTPTASSASRLPTPPTPRAPRSASSPPPSTTFAPPPAPPGPTPPPIPTPATRRARPRSPGFKTQRRRTGSPPSSATWTRPESCCTRRLRACWRAGRSWTRW